MNAPIPNYYDPANARQLLGWASAAYTSRNDSAQLSPTIIEDAATDTKVLIGHAGAELTELIVAFRGTQSLTNFVTDIRARRVPCGGVQPRPGIEVHEGFQIALDSVWHRLDAAITTALPVCRLWLTGHSLGGALAKLAAARLSLPIAGVYTFGEPRVGNAAFRDNYNRFLKRRTFRVVDGEDFITRIPWLLGMYRHSGTEVFYDSLGVPHVNPPIWLKGISDIFGTWSEWRRDGRLALLNDHHVNRYLNLFPVERPAEI